MSHKLPAPRDQQDGCIWLPRILAKARLLLRGQLAPEYAARFCHPGGVDNQFLTHLGLTRDDILFLAELPESEAKAAFLKRIGNDPERIAQWNHVAVNLGRPGFPLAERLPVALLTTYKHLAADSHKFSTVFEVIEADEAITTPA
jgi:hypothetical protein